MATRPQTSNAPLRATSRRRPHDERITNLMKLQRAAQRITSVLDLNELVEKVVADVAKWFGCIEANLYLIDDKKNEFVLSAVHGCTLHGKGHRLSFDHGMVGWVARTGQIRYAPDVSQDPHYIACEPDIRSELDIPLKVNGKVIGVFSAEHSELDAFSPESRHLLQGLADHIAVAVDNAMRYGNERSLREQMSKEASEAHAIQRALLPNASPLVPGFAIDGGWSPARTVGGDWFDYIPLEEGHWGLVLADVAGKGTAAALLMSATRAMFRSLADHFDSPGELLERLNQFVVQDFPSGRFVTLIYGILDPATATMKFASAGHPFPLLVEGNDARLLEGEPGLPLGIAASEYPPTSIKLTPGSRLLLYSDGITDMLNAEREEFGCDRLCQHLLRPDVTADSILEEVKRFSAGAPPADDATVVLVRRALPN
jgi:phosphoserine phosphatase RsbU/P